MSVWQLFRQLEFASGSLTPYGRSCQSCSCLRLHECQPLLGGAIITSDPANAMCLLGQISDSSRAYCFYPGSFRTLKRTTRTLAGYVMSRGRSFPPSYSHSRQTAFRSQGEGRCGPRLSGEAHAPHRRPWPNDRRPTTERNRRDSRPWVPSLEETRQVCDRSRQVCHDLPEFSEIWPRWP